MYDYFKIAHEKCMLSIYVYGYAHEYVCDTCMYMHMLHAIRYERYTMNIYLISFKWNFSPEHEEEAFELSILLVQTHTLQL